MAERKSWYSVKALAAGDQGGPVEIWVYDEIGSFGIAASDFVRELASIGADEITLRINSPGGAVFDGLAIGNAIAGHPAHVTGVVDGIAASIASVIAVKCDSLEMRPNSSLMLHNAWDVVVGSADEMEQAAERLRNFSANIASIYAAKAGGSVEDWQSVMDAETWYTADEAVAAGLADRVIREPNKATTSYARASFDLSKFKFAGRDAAPAPLLPSRTQTPQPSNEAEAMPDRAPDRAVGVGELLSKAYLDGRISADRMDWWAAALLENPIGARKLLEQLPRGISPVSASSATRTHRPAAPAAAAPARPLLAGADVDPTQRPGQVLVAGKPYSQWTQQERDDYVMWKLGGYCARGVNRPPEQIWATPE